MKESYKDASSKRLVQNKILNSQNKKIVALGGPDILDYIQLLKNKGFTDITIYENDKKTYLKQKEQNPDCKLVYGNILHHLYEDAFYDLDFCCCISSVERYLPRILQLEEFSMTFSIRPLGFDKTFEIFKRYGEAPFIPYRDTTPMIVFFNTKTNKNGKSSLLLQQRAN